MTKETEYPPVRTMHLLPFDHYSVAVGRREQMEHGQLLLAASKCTCGTHPTPLAQDMVLRLSRLARDPATFSAPNYLTGLGLGSAQTLEAQAYEEAVNMLGTYIRRLEETARQYADHLAQHHPDGK